MSWISKYRKHLGLKKFRKRTQKLNFEHRFVDLKEATTVSLIINVNIYTSKDLIIITDFINKLEETGKQVFIIEINSKKKSEPIFSETNRSIFINADDITWTGHPSPKKINQINKLHCNILINLDLSENMTSKYISGLVNAETRMGVYEEGHEDFYDYMVGGFTEETGTKEILSKFEFYLKMIKK